MDLLWKHARPRSKAQPGETRLQTLCAQSQHEDKTGDCESVPSPRLRSNPRLIHAWNFRLKVRDRSQSEHSGVKSEPHFEDVTQSFGFQRNGRLHFHFNSVATRHEGKKNTYGIS